MQLSPAGSPSSVYGSHNTQDLDGRLREHDVPRPKPPTRTPDMSIFPDDCQPVNATLRVALIQVGVNQ